MSETEPIYSIPVDIEDEAKYLRQESSTGDTDPDIPDLEPRNVQEEF